MRIETLDVKLIKELRKRSISFDAIQTESVRGEHWGRIHIYLIEGQHHNAKIIEDIAGKITNDYQIHKIHDDFEL